MRVSSRGAVLHVCGRTLEGGGSGQHAASGELVAGTCDGGHRLFSAPGISAPRCLSFTKWRYWANSGTCDCHGYRTRHRRYRTKHSKCHACGATSMPRCRDESPSTLQAPRHASDRGASRFGAASSNTSADTARHTRPKLEFRVAETIRESGDVRHVDARIGVPKRHVSLSFRTRNDRVSVYKRGLLVRFPELQFCLRVRSWAWRGRAVRSA